MKKTLAVLLAVVLMLSCSVMLLAQDLPFVPFGPKVKISGLSLVLDGEIGLVYHIEVPEQYQGGYAVLTCHGDDEPMQVDIADLTTDTQGRFLINYPLSALQLSEPVTVTVYAADGTALATKAKSAEEYVAVLIEDKNSTKQEIAVAKALTNYGHYAQLACAEYGGWTVGEEYAETSYYHKPTVSKEVFDEYAVTWKGNGLCNVTFQLSLDYKTDFVIYLPSGNQTPTVTVNGKAPDSLVKCADGRYKLTVCGINALHLGDPYEICVNGTLTFTASPFSYAVLAMNGASENTKLALLCLYEFYEAIQGYNE